MKKDVNKILLISLCSILLISFFAGVVSAETILDKLTSAWNAPGHFWDTWFQGTSFAQFLLFALVTLLVFAIMEFVPFVEDKGWLAFGISVIIGILSIAYLKPEEVYSILLSYEALGIALTSIIPFLLVAVISKKLHEKGHTMFSKVLWIVMGVVVSLKYITAETAQLGNFGLFAYPLVIVAIIIMILFENWIYFKIFKATIKGEVSEAGSLYVAHLSAKMEKILDQLDSAGPETQKKLQEEYDKLKKKLDKANSK